MKINNLNLILIVCVLSLVTVSVTWAMGRKAPPGYIINLSNKSTKEIQFSKVMVDGEKVSFGVLPPRINAGHGFISYPLPENMLLRWSYEYVYDEDKEIVDIYECLIPIDEKFQNTRVEDIKLEILGDCQVRVSFWKGTWQNEKKLGEYVVDCCKTDL